MTTKKPSGRSHGFKHKSRSIMTKNAPRGVSFLLREYHEGDKALVIIDPRHIRDYHIGDIMAKLVQ